MLWFAIFIFNQREINYRRQIDRSKEVMEVSDWHSHSSQHFIPEGIAPDLGLPGTLGTPPPLSNTSLIFFCNNHSLFFAGMPLSTGQAHSPTMAVKAKRKFPVKLNSLVFLIVDPLLWTCVQACVWEWVSEWVSVRENKSCPKQENKRAMIPLCFHPPGLLMPCRCPQPLFISKVLYLFWGFLSCSALCLGYYLLCDPSCGWQAWPGHFYI